MTSVREFHNIMAQFKGVKHFVLQMLKNDSPVEPSIDGVAVTAEQPTLINIKDDSLAIRSASLDEVLQGMQTCLAKVIGPIAKIVFQDAVHQWKQHKSTDSNDLPLLSKMVLSQIDDPDHKRKFEELITDYIENQR